MEISLRSVLAAGVTAVTAGAVVAAPAVVLAPPELEPVVVAADVAPMNAASDLINSVYGVTRYWANYASLDIAPWALGWVPFGYLVSDQIFIWYPGGGWQPGFVLPVTDSFVYDFLDPVVNNPLDLGAWGSGVRAVTDAAVNGVAGGVNNEIRYALSFDWLPFPLPPLPFPTAASQSALTAAGEPLSDVLNATVQALIQAARTIAGDMTLDLGTRVDQIAALLRDGPDQIAGADLNGPGLVDRSEAAQFTPPGVLEGPSVTPRSFVDVPLPGQRVDESEATPAPEAASENDTAEDSSTGLMSEPVEQSGLQSESAVESESAEEAEQSALKEFKRADRPSLTTPRKALAAANEAGRESAKKATDTLRAGAKSLRDGLRKITGSVVDKPKPQSDGADGVAGAAAKKERASSSASTSDDS